ncbi:MAG: long-chain fatty acid--CoA ligase [Bacteroidales bacterium]
MERIFDILKLYQNEYHQKPDALIKKHNSRWIRYSAHDYLKYSKHISQAFLHMGVKKGQHIATIMNNCPEWNIIDMGLLQIGAIQVPVYPTISKDHFRHIIAEAEVKIVIIGLAAVYEEMREVLNSNNIQVFCLEKSEGTFSFEELLKTGEKYPAEEKIRELSDSVAPDDTATLIYTSGTTGLPKGVMLTHRNLISQVKATTPISGLNSSHRALSFLPLCHIYERMLNYMYQNLGISIYYAESIDTIGQNIREVKPHIFCAVPRVLEKTYDKIVSAGRDLNPIPKNIFFWALNLGKRFEPNEKGSIIYRLQLWLADLLVFKKWRKALGNELQLVVSGSASLQEHIARVFWAAGIKIVEGYGLTETSPVIAVSTPNPKNVKIGTVGTVLPGVELKIADDGEILTRGPHLMKAYFKQPELTKEIIDPQGWLKTGDIGELVDNRFLRITDRKKEMFKTSGGKYIAPQVLENLLKESPFIENAIVIGDGKHFATALIVPEFNHVESWCNIKKLTYKGPEETIKTDQIINRFRKEVSKINQKLGKTERIKRFLLLSDPFSIKEKTLSPTLKLRRNHINETYKHEIEKLYANEMGINVEENNKTK